MRPDVVVLMTDQERAAPAYEPPELKAWRREKLLNFRWFEEHGVSFRRHYTGSLACVPSRPTLFTGQYPDVHGVTQTNGLGKMEDDSRMRWLRTGEVPTLGHWFRAGGYDTQYVGKWHMTHADVIDPATGHALATHDADGVVDRDAVQAYLDADPLDELGFSGWIGPEPHGADPASSGLVCDRVYADRALAWLDDRYRRRRAGDPDAQTPFLLVVCFVNPHDIVFAPLWLGLLGRGNPFADDPDNPPAVPPSPTDDEDLSSKPAAQIAYRASYPSTYRPSSSAPTAREHRSTATSTTASTSRRTSSSNAFGGRSRRGPRMPSSYAPPTTASSSARTAVSTRSGSTSTTKPRVSPSSSRVRERAALHRAWSRTRPHHTWTWCRRSSAPLASTPSRRRTR